MELEALGLGRCEYPSTHSRQDCLLVAEPSAPSSLANGVGPESDPEAKGPS